MFWGEDDVDMLGSEEEGGRPPNAPRTDNPARPFGDWKCIALSGAWHQIVPSEQSWKVMQCYDEPWKVVGNSEKVAKSRRTLRKVVESYVLPKKSPFP